MKGRQLLSTFGTFLVREPEQPTPLNPAWDSLVARPVTRRGLDIAMSAAQLDKGRLVCVRFGKATRVMGQVGKAMRALRFSIGGNAKVKINGAVQEERNFFSLPNGSSTLFETSDAISPHFQVPHEVLDRAAAVTPGQSPLPDMEISPEAGHSLRGLAVMGARELEILPAAMRTAFARNLERLLAARWAAAILEQLPNLRRPEPLIGRRKVADLREWAALDHEDPLTVGDLGARCGLGLRALQKNFLRHFDTTPGEFLRGLRLQKARKLILGGTLSVTGAALDAGFVHLGHFSANYQREFGELPSATVARSARERASHSSAG